MKFYVQSISLVLLLSTVSSMSSDDQLKKQPIRKRRDVIALSPTESIKQAYKKYDNNEGQKSKVEDKKSLKKLLIDGVKKGWYKDLKVRNIALNIANKLNDEDLFNCIQGPVRGIGKYQIPKPIVRKILEDVDSKTLKDLSDNEKTKHEIFSNMAKEKLGIRVINLNEHCNTITDENIMNYIPNPKRVEEINLKEC